MADGDISRCPDCGTVRATRAGSFDLCPACLLTAALLVDAEPCPYQVMAPIAEDPQGVTYLAQRITGASSYVALKIYGGRDDTDAVLSRYQHWKPALDLIDHPSLRKLLSVGVTAEGRLYSASEYVPGWPVTALEGHAAIGVEARAVVARQLVAAVEAAHTAGVVHLKLDASKIVVSTATAIHATILGLGSGLVVDGREAVRETDLIALVTLLRQLGIDLPERRYPTAHAIGSAIPAAGEDLPP